MSFLKLVINFVLLIFVIAVCCFYVTFHLLYHNLFFNCGWWLKLWCVLSTIS